ncbi:GNAT family N-acetyltransferase [Flavobacterium sp. UMI-01]|uniref:GNAT family N-acetyltransferase n=1 Tax=Flavobacterium sp. UMI-01 TaxID=1441053 RepID=UPI001C7D5B4C|nr:GNAT family N-acetyltransferase [Flavobacterium sp. UMI-01]GIZ08689.1 N-acetyltransferase [Flavobacterium sp. UMI-01]
MIEILPATPKDFPSIQFIAQQTWPVAYASILSQEQLYYMLNLFYSVERMVEDFAKGHHFALAKEKNEAIGFVSFEHFILDESRTKIHKLYVLPNQQTKGIGRALITYVTQLAIENQTTAVFLNVNRNNKAVEFYKNNGFVITKEENISIGEGYWMEDYVMEKKI